MVAFWCNNTGYTPSLSLTTVSGTGDPWIRWCTTSTTTSNTLYPIYNTQWIPMGFIPNTTFIDQQNLLVMMSQYPRYERITAPHVRRQNAIADAEVLESQRKQRKERDAVAAKAKELLLKHLTPEQHAQMLRDGWFVVEGGKSKKQYRINVNRGYAGNIEEICEKSKAIVARICCHASRDIPEHDQFLTQKLMLEADEEAFLRVANRR